MQINFKAKHKKTGQEGLVLYLDFVNRTIVVAPDVDYADGNQETWKDSDVELTQIDEVTLSHGKKLSKIAKLLKNRINPNTHLKVNLRNILNLKIGGIVKQILRKLKFTFTAMWDMLSAYFKLIGQIYAEVDKHPNDLVAVTFFAKVAPYKDFTAEDKGT